MLFPFSRIYVIGITVTAPAPAAARMKELTPLLSAISLLSPAADEAVKPALTDTEAIGCIIEVLP